MDADPKYPTAANAFPAFHAATGSASSVLRELEWSKAYSYCTGWPCCPICKGVKPGHGADEAGRLPLNQGHREGCRLAAAISEPNTQAMASADEKTTPNETTL